MKRFFSPRERGALYRAADGRCVKCGADLEVGWHADHRDPHARGGETKLFNGQALCPTCNGKKGARTVTYEDTFQPRPFQREVVDAVQDGMSAGRRVTVVIAGPGSGKTLSYQVTANELHRESLVDFVAVFVPRLILARQCEVKWLVRNQSTGETTGDHRLFDGRKRLGPIRHTPNRTPIIPPNSIGVGFVTTYSSLVQDPAIFIDWAERNRGRFLLIADEAQFCGSTNDDRSGGTRAGGYIQRLHEYSAHTLLLTGTPYRSDGQPLILAKYDQVDEVGRRRLLSDVEATYRDGVTEGYLRPFEATLHDARVRWRAVTNDVHEYDLSNNGTDLREVLRNPEVYQPIVDQVVKLVGRKQRINESYRGLISCMEQADARKVHDYLRREHPSIQTRIAVSDDGADAEEALRQFGMETKVADILVTVRKAFIGYDCPQITVVGVLTNYRDPGHLMQLVGRGLRMWTGTGGQPQSCLVVAPDDPEMQAFIDFMRDESNAGMKEREQHQQGDGDHSPKTPEKLGGVESAHATTHRAIGPDAEVAHKELVYIEALMTEYGMVGDATKLAQLLAREQVGWLKAHSERPATLPAEVTSDPLINEEPALTESEQIQEVGRRTRSAINKYLNSAGFSPKAPDYGRLVARMTDAVNREAGVSSKEVWTMVEASRRLDAVATLAHQGWLPS